MKIILDTTSSNPDYGGDCDCAVVDLTPALVDRIRRRVELARRVAEEDTDLYELYFWGGEAAFYDHNLVEACEEAMAADMDGQKEDKNASACARSSELQHSCHALFPGVDLQAHQPQRTECAQMILRCGRPQYEVAWTVIPKHTDIYVTTRGLALSAIDAYLCGSQKRSD